MFYDIIKNEVKKMIDQEQAARTLINLIDVVHQENWVLLNNEDMASKTEEYYILHQRSLFLSQKPSDNTSTDTQIIPTIKDPQIDSSYINQFAKFILPYIQQDYEREPFKKNGS